MYFLTQKKRVSSSLATTLRIPQLMHALCIKSSTDVCIKCKQVYLGKFIVHECILFSIQIPSSDHKSRTTC